MMLQDIITTAMHMAAEDADWSEEDEIRTYDPTYEADRILEDAPIVGCTIEDWEVLDNVA